MKVLLAIPTFGEDDISIRFAIEDLAIFHLGVSVGDLSIGFEHRTDNLAVAVQSFHWAILANICT